MLTVDDFLLLDRSGAFDAHAKSELIDGTIVVVNAQYSQHFTVKTLLLRRLAEACDRLDNGMEAWVAGTIAMPPHSAPEPDLVVTSVRPVAGPAAIETVVLVVEVSDSTVAFDRGDKARIYAAGDVPEYWVVDLPGRAIHQHWEPGTKEYLKARTVPLGEPIVAATITGLGVKTGGLIADR